MHLFLICTAVLNNSVLFVFLYGFLKPRKLWIPLIGFLFPPALVCSLKIYPAIMSISSSDLSLIHIFLSSGKFLNVRVLMLLQIDHLQNQIDSAINLICASIVRHLQAGCIIKHLPQCQIFVNNIFLRYITDDILQVLKIFRQINTAAIHISLEFSVKTVDDIHQGCFSRARSSDNRYKTISSNFTIHIAQNLLFSPYFSYPFADI